MNTRSTINLAVSGLAFQRGTETYTARVEINWGLPVLPYVFEQVIYGTESATYLAAADTLSPSELNEQYPPTVYAPGFATSTTALCQFNITIFAASEVYSGLVVVSCPENTLSVWVGGEWVEYDGWSRSIPGIVPDPESSQNGDIFSLAVPLFVGDPNDVCGNDTGGGGGTTGTGTSTPSGSGGNMGGFVSPAPSSTEASLPGCVTLTEYTCPATATQEDPACDRNCGNPFYALDHLDDCDAPSVSSLRIEPSTVRSAVGRRGVYRVVAVFSNGQEGDVTSEATTTIADSAKSTLLAKGIVSGVAAGSTTLTAAWQGRTATASVSVFTSQCAEDVQWDVVFVLDQATSSYWLSSRPSAPGCGVYWRRTVGQSDYMAEYGTAALALMLGMSLKNVWQTDAGNDRIAIVATGNGAPILKSTWSDTIPSVTPLCQATTDSRLGEALRIAKTMFTSARSSVNKLVVLFTAGSESVCSPSAMTAATELKDAGAYVAVVTPLHAGMPWTVFSPCTYPEEALDYLDGVALHELAQTAHLLFTDSS